MNSFVSTGYSSFVTVAALIMLLICVGIIIYFRTGMKKLKNSAYADPITDGLTQSGFYAKWHKTLNNDISSYSVISMQIPYLSQTYASSGNDEEFDILKNIHNLFSSQLSSEELFARTGEDTFLFTLKQRSHEKICAKLIRITNSVNRISESKNRSYSLVPVFGIYLPKSNNESLSDMENKAIYARLNASEEKRFSFYNDIFREKTEQLHETASSIERALKNHEFVVYYQPKVRISDLKIIGAEALIRWRHPLKGILSPDMFLPMAEKYRIIESLDRFVFTEVCRSISDRNNQELEPCPISLNLSRADITNPELPQELYDICCSMNVSPSLIELEMKEHLILENPEKSKTLIEKLHLHGFRCTVDNFGADICSLQTLSSFDIDTLKLDKSFFSGSNNNRQGRHIIESILKLAAQLHIRTVAEGIDSHGQVQYLQQAACDVIQGFYYFKPMPREIFERNIYDEKALRYADKVVTSFTKEADKRQLPDRQSLAPLKNIILFSYRPEDDSIEFSDIFSPVLGDKKYFEDASALFRTTDLIHENDRKDFFRLLERCQREDGWAENTLRFYMSEGRYEWLELKLRQDDHNGGAVSGMMANMSVYENEVNRWKEKATRDALTGLYNREYFEQNVSKLLSRGIHSTAAILFIDVDNFKTVNDTYGHMFGDNVLCYMAKQIMGVFRHTDIIARYGGDEFVVFAPSIEREILEKRLNKLYSIFKYPYRNDAIEYNLSSSIGAAMFPDDGTDYETLLNHADCALYEAKERGKCCYVMYEPYMQVEASSAANKQNQEA